MKIIRRILIWCRNIFFSLFIFSIATVLVYKYVPIHYTPLMLIRLFEPDGTDRIEHQWVSIKQISQPVIQAVVASEDNLFMEHSGFDRSQINKALEEARKGRRLRGASTISQQTAKNVFLWPRRSYFRKGLEAYFTVLIEWIWGKERIMEVYLNSIEMGAGIYGIEAAAFAYFGKPAEELTRGEGALIAAILPDPRKRDPAHPSAYLQGRQRDILSLMRKIETVNMGYRPFTKTN
ncbi:MAG: monofunctional biosynthetic peptidoglycan transglycosylase [Tannerella sp.]|jgi:monofunctional biosynthetic peptidoglycan transglycosylase|nr:monofunctional biosynthetic peptidoglycan transglycosylase [Tannerella sp.]